VLGEIELIELNEAFAAQVIACDRELGFDSNRLNVNGRAIALGHPIGCTGVRRTTALVHEMRRRSARFGLSTLYVSGGMGHRVNPRTNVSCGFTDPKVCPVCVAVAEECHQANLGACERHRTAGIKSA